MAKSFQHNFKPIFGVIDANGLAGYLKCLQELQKYLEEKTEWKPENRYIDAADLSESITLTLTELNELQKEALDDLQITLSKFKQKQK